MLQGYTYTPDQVHTFPSEATSLTPLERKLLDEVDALHEQLEALETATPYIDIEREYHA